MSSAVLSQATVAKAPGALTPVGARFSFPGSCVSWPTAPASTQACKLPSKRLLESKEASCCFPEVLQAQCRFWHAHAEAAAAVVSA